MLHGLDAIISPTQKKAADMAAHPENYDARGKKLPAGQIPLGGSQSLKSSTIMYIAGGLAVVLIGSYMFWKRSSKK